MTKFIERPTVHAIAASAFANIVDWIIDPVQADALDIDNSPISKLSHAVSYGETTLDHIVEHAGRMCYRSFGKGRGHEEYIQHLLESGHGSVFEHASITLSISGVSRALSHELVRHRAGFAISQESQRYVDASEINFVLHPTEIAEGEHYLNAIKDQYIKALTHYQQRQEWLRDAHPDWEKKRVNQAARMVLPNAAETRLDWTGNLRALRHVLELRGGDGADPEIRRLMIEILLAVSPLAPNTFADFSVVSKEEETYLECRYSKT